MVFQPTFTTEARVDGRLQNISADMTSGQQWYAIEDAEGVIESAMQKFEGSDFTFDAEKHKLIQAVATDLAAFYCILYNPTTFVMREKVALMADMLWATSQRGLGLLSDPKIIKWLMAL